MDFIRKPICESSPWSIGRITCGLFSNRLYLCSDDCCLFACDDQEELEVASLLADRILGGGLKMLLIESKGGAIACMLLSLLFLGTWPAVLAFLERRGRLPQHTYLDYSITNLLAAVIIALTLGQIGDSRPDMPNFITQLHQVTIYQLSDCFFFFVRVYNISGPSAAVAPGYVLEYITCPRASVISLR